MKSVISKNPILIIDRAGLIGEPLSRKLFQEFSVVLVGRGGQVSFSGKFPRIPDNKYSQIIFIDEEGRDLELLPKIIEKVKNVNADFIFAQGLSPKGEYAVNKILRLYPSAKVVIFGDIFENKLILRGESFRSAINKFIYQAQKFGRIQILGEGLREAYPVFLADVVDGLRDIVLGKQKSHSLFYLFPKYPVSELSLSHMIQKINPEITIDFVRHDAKLKSIFYPLNGEYLLSDKYPIAQKIRNIDISKKVKAQDVRIDGDAKKLKNLPAFIQHRSGAGFIIWILIFLLFFPYIFTILFSFLGLNTLNYAKGEVDKGNFVNAKSSLHLSQTFFFLGKQTSNLLLFQVKSFSQNLDSDLKISESLLQIFNSGIYFSKILDGKSQDPSGDFAKGQNNLKYSIIALDKLKAEGKIPAPISQKLEIVNPLIKLLSSTADILPDILGMDGQKIYLILFQDNRELRPGGGLISSYGILKFNRGKITEFAVHDISDADKLLRGHVEPPFALRRYLPSVHWYMKDSNFDVDFVKAASSAANFLLVETGQKASGVIAIDFAFPEDILNSKAYLLIAQAISDALAQKHLLLELNNESQNIFTVNGWSSSLWDERRDMEGSANDFLGINEANLGLNQVNNYIERKVSQKVALENDGNISEELTINYRNKSTASSGGEYKNYLRIILPKEAKLSEISVNDISQVLVDAITDPLIYEAKKFKAPLGLEVEKTQEENKAIFGFLVRIPAGEVAKVKLKYAFPIRPMINAFSYNLKLFKQPGIDNLPYSLTLTYPNSFNIIKSSDKIIGGEGRIMYSEKIASDKNLIINFAKK
ncbi:MAG: hypothetical protein HW400_710 [Candidatus Levybacteria bacterium]|nr:hypothetical protein [Candidatus Levybacteria bacterium]